MFVTIFNDLLKSHKINALALSKSIGVPKSIVYEWKNGEREPSVENLVKLSEYFGVSLEYLIGTTQSNEENELYVMLRNTKAIPESERAELISILKKSIDDYLDASRKKNTDK